MHGGADAVVLQEFSCGVSCPGATALSTLRITHAKHDFDCSREYLEDTMVLCTRFETETGSVRAYDLLVQTDVNRGKADRQLVRIVEGLEGQVELDVEVQPRFGFGDIKPWLRQHDTDPYIALGGENGLVICGDMGLKRQDRYSLGTRIRVCKGERKHLSIRFSPPEQLDDAPERLPDAGQLDLALERTEQWWRLWSRRIDTANEDLPSGFRRSANILKALNYLLTGAIITGGTGIDTCRRVFSASTP